ncbi:RNA-guided endonuclease InsQ/TnpB family protein [Anaerosalibacter sp. Marseille-P3206]|uniref:RNA-guided endonuclease InsQ/TnpB family protein n=1 Tax=Anaerosalibacter sp. Marseille-P3206 TaxID=1871005 RepID=UPI00190EA52D|nr:RNA-guided endonuclease TnpB family protein [Anaerosalibacter sp. Marseille-P3206]
MNVMIFNRKIEVIFTKQDELILDGQSKICNWLYNHLLEMTIKDYKENNNDKKLLTGRNLRNQVPILKQEFIFLYSVHSSPLKNTAIRLKETYKKFFNNETGYPKFKSWKKHWFSLYYDEPNKGFKLIENKNLQISLGINKENKRIKVIGKLKENLNLRNTDKIKNFRLCKQQGNKFYAIFCIERKDIDKKETNKWIAIDQNHKNFFVAIDNTGVSYEFEKLPQTKYWDKVIDEIKSKRDLCSRKSKLIETETGRSYYLPSKRWTKLNKALDNAYHKRREQIKSSCYSIANWIAKNYDYVAIRDYTPSLNTATYDNMHRSMLNQEIIGEFRNILKWVMERSGKHYSKVDEKDTTKNCCICGNKEKKDPQIREFTCQKCKTKLSRDINSSVNIAKKDKLLSGSDYVDWDLYNSTYTAKWNFKKSKILFTGHTLEKSNIWMN